MPYQKYQGPAIVVRYHSRQFAMSHGSYDSNLGSEILNLARDIRLRSWLNIDTTDFSTPSLGLKNLGLESPWLKSPSS